MKIEIGSIVYLKSGSPPLIVTDVTPSAIVDYSEIEVSFFDEGGNFQVVIFPQICLTVEKP